MTRRATILGGSLCAAAVAFAAAVLIAHHGGAGTQATAASVSKTSATTSAAAAAPPTFPPGVTNPPHLTALSGGGKTVTCDQHVGTFYSEPGLMQGLPKTPRELFGESTVVVVATATESHGYWQKDDGHLPTQNLTGLDWALLTATNFSVERTLKGTAAAWRQVIDEGADPRTIASCPNLATVARGWPLPTVGQRYVIFLQLDRSRGVIRDTLGPLDYFPVTRGVVHSPIDGSDTPLDQFISSLRG